MTLKIDDEFRDLIPPLSAAEYQQLEANILSDGIREPLVIWNGTIIDGHNRYSVAQRHNLPFTTVEMDFADRNAAIEWIVQNQFGRRNISTFDRVALALKLKPVIAAKAHERMIAGTVGDPMPDLAQGTTNEQIAKIAGVGKETVRRVEVILKSAPEYVLEWAKRGDISIQMAYEAVQMKLAKLKELAEKINQSIAKANENFEQAVYYFQWLKSNLPPDEYQAVIQKKFGVSADVLEKNLIDLGEMFNVPAPLKEKIQQLAAPRTDDNSQHFK